MLCIFILKSFIFRIEHYALKCNDIQMAAMIACVFSQSNFNPKSYYNNNLLDDLEDSNKVKSLHFTLQINLKHICWKYTV